MNGYINMKNYTSKVLPHIRDKHLSCLETVIATISNYHNVAFEYIYINAVSFSFSDNIGTVLGDRIYSNWNENILDILNCYGEFEIVKIEDIENISDSDDINTHIILRTDAFNYKNSPYFCKYHTDHYIILNSLESDVIFFQDPYYDLKGNAKISEYPWNICDIYVVKFKGKKLMDINILNKFTTIFSDKDLCYHSMNSFGKQFICLDIEKEKQNKKDFMNITLVRKIGQAVDVRYNFKRLLQCYALETTAWQNVIKGWNNFQLLLIKELVTNNMRNHVALTEKWFEVARMELEYKQNFGKEINIILARKKNETL